jgi:hypothetical protein
MKYVAEIGPGATILHEGSFRNSEVGLGKGGNIRTHCVMIS